MSDRKLDILRKLNDAHQSMQTVAHQIAPGHFIYASWRIKEVIAHLVGWENATVRTLTAYLDADDEPAIIATDGIDQYNAQSIRTYQSTTLNDVIQEWENQRNALKEKIRQLSNSQLDEQIVYPWGGSGTIANLLKGMAYHERQHAHEIREMLQKSGEHDE